MPHGKPALRRRALRGTRLTSPRSAETVSEAAAPAAADRNASARWLGRGESPDRARRGERWPDFHVADFRGSSGRIARAPGEPVVLRPGPIRESNLVRAIPTQSGPAA